MTKRNLEAKARAGHDSVMLRGGRLVKRKGQVLSFAPHVGQLSSVSCGALATSFVLGAALFGATPAIAGTCDPLTPTPNPDGSAVTCSAPADEAIDETQVIVGQQLTVTTAPGFGISTSAGDGLNFNVASGYNSGLTFVDTNESQITAAETALSGNAVGTTTITSNGALDGGTYGIKFAVASVGSLTIDSTGSVNGETEDGINASISGEARNITVRAATVAGGDDGINVVNNAYGNTLIESSLSVIAAPGGGVGVVAVNRGRLSENLTVNVADVTGNAGGIEVSNLGTGATVVTSSVRVFTENGDGISANNDGFYNPITQSFDIFTTDMTVTTNIVEAANNGIIAINSGNGSTSISSSSYVSGNSGDGIGVTNGPNAQNLTIHAAAVDGGDDGIVAVNEGSGVTLVSTTGYIVGGDIGISVGNGINSGNVTVNAFENTVTGGKDGIVVSNNGSGNLSITSTGDVIGTTGTGINASAGSDVADVIIHANDVTGDDSGIVVKNDGKGATLVNATGLVQGYTDYGIAVIHGSDTTNLTVVANNVTGGTGGIFADNEGTGFTSVTVSGDVTGRGDLTVVGGVAAGGDGINIYSDASTTGLTVIAGVGSNVTGINGDGIEVRNLGAGQTTVTSYGEVTGGATRNGIYAVSHGLATGLTVTAVDVTAGLSGIVAAHSGTGDVTVTATGNVQGGTSFGIYGIARHTATNLTISAHDVTGGAEGIFASNAGHGSTSVTSDGVVTGGYSGVVVINTTSYYYPLSIPTNLTVSVAEVSGGSNGIFTSNYGSGTTSITASGLVTGLGGDGIYAFNGQSASDLTIDIVSADGGDGSGVNAKNAGAGGNTSVTSTGTVTGTVDGIYADNRVGTTNLTIDANVVTGGDDGIDAKNDGDGFTLITADGDVEGKGIRDGIGISAVNGEAASSLEIIANNANTVRGGSIGIFAQNLGNGATSVSSTGDVIGGIFDGITALNSGTTLTLDVNKVTGGLNGIYAKNEGNGATLITASGLVTGNGDDGIDALNAVDALELTIVANAVKGARNGIDAQNEGSGNTTITANGLVTGTGGDGILVSTYGVGSTSITANALVTGGDDGINVFIDDVSGALEIIATDVYAGDRAIEVFNDGLGATLVSASGDVSALRGDGINVFSSGTTVTVNANNVGGGFNGIYTRNNGNGATLITASGLVTGNGADGIYAVNATSASNLVIDIVDATGVVGNGINAVNNGVDGYTSVTSTGTVTGALDGILAANVVGTTDLTIVANVVTGGVDGIDARNNGDGFTTITATGDVTGEGADGIYALNANFATDLTIVAEGDVYGLESGISAANNGSGVLSITATGDVDGKNEDGIRAVTGLNTTGLTVGANVIVDAANVTGGSNGIFVRNTGGAGTSISASGTVEGTTGAGIDVANDFATSDLTVTANIVTGGTNGINARNDGDGFTTVTADGLVTGGANGNGIDVFNDASASALTVNASAVTAGVNGIFVTNDGSGATLVSASGAVTGGTADGIYATTAGTNLTVAPSGDVTGGDDGIDARNNGDGFTSIAATGDVTGEGADGIYALNANFATDLTIVAEGDVYGLARGISAANNGTGILSITATGDVDGKNEDGIRAVTGLNTTGVTQGANVIVVAANVTGGTNGIFVRNTGGAATSISASGTVEGTTGVGIDVANGPAATDLTVTANAVTGGLAGISASNDGTGSTSVTAFGLVTGGASDNGIDVFNDASAGALTVDAATVTGGLNGIFVDNDGSGATVISASAAVTGSTADGIHAESSGTSLTIELSGAVTGGINGVYSNNSGIGSTSITATGDVTGTIGDGISGRNGADATGLTIVANNVSGGDNGIDVFNGGLGVTSVTSTGAVTAVDNGIDVTNAASATDLSVVANNVTAGSIGIEAFNIGTGFTSITATGEVTGGDQGISVFNAADTTDLTVVANDVTGGFAAISTANFGTGFTSVTSSGTVTGTAVGTNSYGIYAYNGADATDLTISANTVIGDDGISVFNDGTGATSITATGKVTGTIFNGVFANSTGTDLTVNVINVAGGDNGIAVSNGGIGATAISSTGTVTGTDGNGVEAVNATTATNLTVSVNTVTGGLNGISTTNEGTGATTITASGDVTGEDADGVYALNANFTTNLTIIAEGDVSGLESGISASNNGSGVLSITARGDVDGANEDGIRAVTGLNTTGVIAGANVIVDANNVTGGSNGIFVSNTGGAATSVIASGTVEGTNGTGINVANGHETTDLTVTAGVVTGGNTGIDADNDGTGFTLITANGLVTGGDNGIDVFNDASASALTVNASAVTGGLNGILAINNGSGATAIAASGVVVGGTADGIHAEASGTNLTVAPSGDVTGGLNGIYANNRGTGSTSITATGDVTGATGDGISSRNGADATSLIIVANNVSGGDNGIDALNTGQGTTSVIANGIVTGFDNGIDVTNFADATDLTVIANTVTGGGNGIESFNLGTGLTSIKSTGSVTGGEKGISAFNAATASSLTVITADVTGGTGGISAVNFGQGHTSVTSTGTVVGANYGIYSYNGEGATDITVSAIDVKAGVDGIYVTNNGRGNTVISSTGTSEGTSGVGILARNLNSDGGALTVTAFSARGLLGGIVVQNDGAGTSSVSVTGTIAGGDGVGIDTFTLDGNLTTINVASTAIVGATSGNAIANNAGDSTLNVAADAIINGSVSLGDGNDTANFVRKGALASVTLLDGGDEVSSVDGSVDTLNLNGADDFNLVGANTVNWENININGGTVAFSDAAILAETINVNNGATFNGSNNLVATANVNVASSSALVVGNAGGTGATRITGNLANSGRIDLRSLTGGNFVGDRLNVSGNFVGSSGGQLVLDTVLNGDGSPSDLLVVGGNASGTNTIVINNVGGAGAFTQSDGIKVVQIGGVSDAAAFTLLGGGVRAGAFRYELFLGGVVDPNDQDWYLRSRIRDLTAPSISLARNSNEIAMTFLGTLHERVGEQEHVSQRGYDEGSAKGLWGRMLGKGFRDKISSANIGDISSTGKFGGMQMGLDVYRGVSDNGSRTFAGVYAGYATGSSNERSQFGGVSRIAGQTDSEGLLAGLYATHYNASGWYANAAVQGSWLDNKASAVDGTNLEANGRTWLASLELGNAFKLGKRGALEPQVQLIYGNTRLDDAVDNTGLVNEFNQSDTLTARGGFRLKTTKPENYNTEGGLFTGYLKANVWSTITGGDIGLNVAGTLIDGFKPKRAWVDAGVGATLTVARNTEIFFDADVEFGIDKQTTAGTGTVGLRFNW